MWRQVLCHHSQFGSPCLPSSLCQQELQFTTIWRSSGGLLLVLPTARPQTDLLKCKRCKSAFYCGRACQTKDWKEHKKTCCKNKSAAKASAGDGPPALSQHQLLEIALAKQEAAKFPPSNEDCSCAVVELGAVECEQCFSGKGPCRSPSMVQRGAPESWRCRRSSCA